MSAPPTQQMYAANIPLRVLTFVIAVLVAAVVFGDLAKALFGVLLGTVAHYTAFLIEVWQSMNSDE